MIVTWKRDETGLALYTVMYQNLPFYMIPIKWSAMPWQTRNPFTIIFNNPNVFFKEFGKNDGNTNNIYDIARNIQWSIIRKYRFLFNILGLDLTLMLITQFL